MNPTLQELISSLPEQVVNHIQHLERMRQDFVANVSHELRTPLTVIHGYLEALLEQDREETKPLVNIFTQMYQQTVRMQNLIEDLLLLSNLENDEVEDKVKKPVKVDRLLEVICKEAKTISGEMNHNIHLHATPCLLLNGVEDELRSLFSNLIFNAVKYTPANGHIEIKWYCGNEHAYFSVKDTGIGIAAEHIPRITERFYRVDPARSRVSGGTGLGLAIAKHVLIRHQGELVITSQLGKGSIFTCAFSKNYRLG